MQLIPAVLDVLFDDAIARDRTTARRAALVEILLHERCLTREQLIARVEGKVGRGCFGEAAWADIFYRDMQVVKRALRAAGYQLAYRRSSRQPGYYLRDQPGISAEMAAILDGSVAEADPNQLTIFKSLSAGQRIQQGCHLSSLACQAVAYRLRQKDPRLSPAEAHRLAVQRAAPYE